MFDAIVLGYFGLHGLHLAMQPSSLAILNLYNQHILCNEHLILSFSFQRVSEKHIYMVSLTTLLGSWVGAFPILLDWNRPWQVSERHMRTVHYRVAVMISPYQFVGVAYPMQHGCSNWKPHWIFDCKSVYFRTGQH